VGDVFSMSQKYLETYHDVGFGLALINGCRHVSNPPGFDQYKRKLLRKMRRRETLAQISKRIETYANFFQQFGRVIVKSGDAVVFFMLLYFFANLKLLRICSKAVMSFSK